MVSAVVDGEGSPLGGVDGDEDADPEGDADGDGGIDGVSSDGPGSTDGAVVGGMVGTGPSPPDDVHAATMRRRPASAGRIARGRGAFIAESLLMR